MSRWRISGGIGDPEPPLEGDQQVMTQGIGFPLRPVDNVIPEGFDDYISQLPISDGLFLQWHGNYQDGLIYPAGSVVLDGGWTMVANVLSVTKPAPIPEGNPTWALPETPTFAEQSNGSVIYSGHLYTFVESGLIKGLRVWVSELTANTNYRIVIIDITDPNTPITIAREEPILTEDAWKVIALGNRLVVAGQKFLAYIDALNSVSTTVVTGGWNYGGSSGNTPEPALANWTKSNKNQNIRINKVDLDSTDRTTELAGFISGTTIQFAETLDPNYGITFTVVGAITDNGGDFGYAVVLTNTSPSGVPRVGNVTTMTATVPVAQLTKYVEVVGTPTPAWATVVPFLEYDGVDQSPGDVAFGIDIEFDPAVVNPEWDLMATTEL